jgi:hypothetical protein
MMQISGHNSGHSILLISLELFIIAIFRYIKPDPYVALVLPAFFCEGSPDLFPKNKPQLVQKASTRACHQIHDDPGACVVIFFHLQQHLHIMNIQQAAPSLTSPQIIRTS